MTVRKAGEKDMEKGRLVRKHRRKRHMAVVAALLLALSIGGCGENVGNGFLSGSKKTDPVPVEDVNNLNPSAGFHLGSIMKGETGFYYLGDGLNYELHYYDIASQNNIFLCNKPECLHQGDEFCTATDDDLIISGQQMYGGKLYFTFYDYSTENHVKVRLFRVEPDGSGLTEIAVIKDITLQEEVKWYGSEFNLCIHRGICMIPYSAVMGDHMIRGTVIYNLLDGSMSELPEYSFEMNHNTYMVDYGKERYRFMGMDKYIYYNEVRPEKKNKTYLCRYNIEDGSVEEAELKTTYKGLYTVWKDEMVVFVDSFSNVCSYDFATQTMKKGNKLKFPMREGYTDMDGEYHDDGVFEYFMGIGEIICLDGKIMVGDSDGVHFSNTSLIYENISDFEDRKGYPWIVLNDDLREERVVHIPIKKQLLEKDEKIKERLGNHNVTYYKSAILDDIWYVETMYALYSCPVADVLAEQGEFTKLFDKEKRDYTVIQDFYGLY